MSRSRRDRARRSKAAIGSIRCWALDALKLSEGGALPTETRIWKAGLNTDRNGYNVNFDAKAAEQVMASYRQHGVELVWDLEHLSLDDEHPNYDPDARASCSLELRNGELWAVNIQWTPDGAARLTNRTQRYPSPAFLTDKDGRPTRVLNIALCAMPATDHIEPLVATETHDMKITLSQVAAATKIARALSKAGVSAASIVKTLADGVPGGSGPDGDVVAGIDIAGLADFLQIDIEPAQDPAGFIKAVLAKMDEITAQLRGDTAPAAAAPAPDPGMAAATPPEEMAAAKLMLRMLPGCEKFTDGVLRLNEWSSIVADHRAAAKKVSDKEAAIESTERTALVVRLQKCGAETPATSGLNEGKLVKRLAEEPIAALRERVSQVELAKSSQTGGPPATPGSEPSGAEGAKNFTVNGKTVELDARELAICKESKCDPATFAMLKARRAAPVART